MLCLYVPINGYRDILRIFINVNTFIQETYVIRQKPFGKKTSTVLYFA